MDTKWTSGFLRVTSPKMASCYLASSTTILSEALVRSLSNDLMLNQEQLARELGYPPQCFGKDGLYSWCKSPGSTIFVLVSVLYNLNRMDCVHRIEQYLQMHSMQLFIKVEEAATQGSPYATSPKFYQVITSCEFSLVQALENILGGDLVKYEIIGPGSWVTWTTLAQELKGQQLTLLLHNQPVAHTREAVYGLSDTGIKINQPVITPNIPVTLDIPLNEETDLKVFDHTQIDSLKCAPDSSVPATTSNNMTPGNSLEFTTAEELTKSNISYKSTDSETQFKVPIARKNNTPENTQVMKVFQDKYINSMNDNHDDITDEENPLHVLNNVPHFSILVRNESIISSNAQRLTSQTTQNSILQTTQSSPIQTTRTMPSQFIPNRTLQSECTKKQNNFNNLNCVTTSSSPQSSYVQNYLDSQIVQKGTDISTYNAVARPGSGSSQVEIDVDDVDNVMHVDNSKSQFSEMKTVSFDTGLAASSLFTEGRQAQHINVSLCTQSVDYVPHAYIQNVDAQSGIVTTPAKKRHRLDSVTNSPLTSPEQQIQQHYQLPGFLGKEVSEPEQLQQVGGLQAFPEVSASNSSHKSAIDHQNYQQQLQDVSQVSGPQYHQTAYHKQSSSDDLGQNSSHQQWDKKPQSFPLPFVSCQQFQPPPAPPRPHQYLHYDRQSTDQQFTCHTPQPQFPDEIPEQNCHPLSVVQRQFRESHFMDTSINKQGHAVIQPEEQASHVMITNNRGQQYVTVLKPHSIGVVNSSSMPTYSRPQHMNSLGQAQSTQLPNFELTVRLPQSDSNAMPSKPQIFLDPRNQSRNASGASSFGNSVGRGYIFANTGATFANGGVTFANTGATFDNGNVISTNSGGQFHNSGAQFHNSGATFTNSGGTFPNNGATFNIGGTFPNNGATFNSGGTFPKNGAIFNSGGTFPNNGATFNSGGTFPNNGATFNSSQLILMQSGEQGPMMTDAQHHTTPPSVSMFNSIGASREEGLNEDITMDEEGYNYIDNGHSPRDRSKPGSRWHSPATPKRAGFCLDTELVHIEGWCPQENGDTIQNTMEMYRSQDGSYIVWKSRRHNKFIITVSHLNKLLHFRVEEAKQESSERIIYYLFEGGFRSESLLDFFQHYRQHNIRVRMQSNAGTKTYLEHIQLRYPVKSVVKRKDPSKST